MQDVIKAKRDQYDHIQHISDEYLKTFESKKSKINKMDKENRTFMVENCQPMIHDMDTLKMQRGFLRGWHIFRRVGGTNIIIDSQHSWHINFETKTEISNRLD